MAEPLSVERACEVLKPLFDLGDFRDLNYIAGAELAALILPRDAMDLTVRELHALLARATGDA